MLVLPGAIGAADGGRALDLLARSREVILLGYGDERRLDPLIERALSSMKNAERFDVLGFSVGGWFGQCLAAREALRVRKLVLANSFALDPNDAWRFALAARIWPLLPASLFRSAVRKRARLALGAALRKEPQLATAALARIGAELSDPETLRRLEAQQHLLRDTLREGGCAASCPVLIIEGADDPILGKAVRERLARRYPAAGRVVLDEVGHAAALAEPEAFAAAVDGFLRA